MKKGAYEIYIRACILIINYRSMIITLKILHEEMVYAKTHAFVDTC